MWSLDLYKVWIKCIFCSSNKHAFNYEPFKPKNPGSHFSFVTTLGSQLSIFRNKQRGGFGGKSVIQRRPWQLHTTSSQKYRENNNSKSTGKLFWWEFCFDDTCGFRRKKRTEKLHCSAWGSMGNWLSPLLHLQSRWNYSSTGFLCETHSRDVPLAFQSLTLLENKFLPISTPHVYNVMWSLMITLLCLSQRQTHLNQVWWQWIFTVMSGLLFPPTPGFSMLIYWYSPHISIWVDWNNIHCIFAKEHVRVVCSHLRNIPQLILKHITCPLLSERTYSRDVWTTSKNSNCGKK